MNFNIKKMRFYKIILPAILFVSIISCSDDLELFAPDKISDPTFWKTPEDFRLAANLFYTHLPNSRNLDLDSDLMRAISPNDVSAGENLPVESNGSWSSSYDKIRTTNNLLEQAASHPEVDASRYIAEAKFFRAYNYYSLVRLYGDVPLITKVLNTGSDELFNTPRSPRENVIDLCISDLQEAIPNLPLRNTMPATELGRVTKGVAQTLLAKIALFEGTWSKYNGGSKVTERLQIAVDASNAVINSNQFELYNAHGDDSYRQLFWNEDADDESIGIKPEKIFSTRFIEGINFHNSSTDAQGLSATKKAVDTYLCIDGLPIDKSPLFQGYGTYTSEFQNRDNRMLNSIVKDGDQIWTNNGILNIDAELNYAQQNYTGYRTWKFNGDGALRAANREISDIEIFRYAEVLLIFAEATFELNGSITDSDLDKSINLLRTRGKIASLTNNLVASNNLDMLTEIRRERTVELMFEGERLEDLKRWGIAVDEMQKPLLGMQWDNSDWNTAPNMGLADFTSHGTNTEGFIIKDPQSTRNFSERNLLLPVPLKELLLTDWSQNPGW